MSTKLNYRIRNILNMNQMEQLFDVIVGADDVLTPKPDPEGLLLALRLLGIGTNSAVYVGDHALTRKPPATAELHSSLLCRVAIHAERLSRCPTSPLWQALATYRASFLCAEAR